MCATSCVSKPWDTLRAPAKKQPLCNGTFKTARCGSKICLSSLGSYDCRLTFVDSYGAPQGQVFQADDLRELAAFATELADQMEGK